MEISKERALIVGDLGHKLVEDIAACARRTTSLVDADEEKMVILIMGGAYLLSAACVCYQNVHPGAAAVEVTDAISDLLTPSIHRSLAEVAGDVP